MGGGGGASARAVLTAPQAPGLRTARTTGATAAGTGITINFNGLVTDPEGTARQIESILARAAVRNARTRPTDRAW